MEDGVKYDEFLSTGANGVYAAGDVVIWYDPLFDRHQRLEHWTSAAVQGSAAVHNALSYGEPKPDSTVPYFWPDWYGSRIQFVGIITDADEVGLVEGVLGVDRRWVALYRKGDRLVGALAVNGQNVIMKYRMLIMREATWQDALAFRGEVTHSGVESRMTWQP